MRGQVCFDIPNRYEKALRGAAGVLAGPIVIICCNTCLTFAFFSCVKTDNTGPYAAF